MSVRCGQAHIQAFQGTYWYHSHFEAQYCDGLRGALIIDDPDDPQESLYDVDNGEEDFLNNPFTGLRSLQTLPLLLSRIGITSFQRRLA